MELSVSINHQLSYHAEDQSRHSKANDPLLRLGGFCHKDLLTQISKQKTKAVKKLNRIKGEWTNDENPNTCTRP